MISITRQTVIFFGLLIGLIISVFSNNCFAGNDVFDAGKILKIEMNLTFEPSEHILMANTKVNWEKTSPDTFFFFLNKNLAINEIRVNEKSVKSSYGINGVDIIRKLELFGETDADKDDYEQLSLYALPVGQSQKKHEIYFQYSGEIFDDVEVASFSRWEIADETTGLISEKGAFLTPGTGYYPELPGSSEPRVYRTTMTYPDGWEAIAEGAIVQRSDNNITFDSEHPIDGSYIVAGPYKISSISRDETEISMYYFEGSQDLTERYINASADYVDKYSELLGEYAYSRFSVVENWFPTGYGMPSYTLLGSSVLRLPFIIYTSLGHEVCHNWWGNGVFVDYEDGNWCEGLTVYCADYLYKMEDSPEGAKQYRLDTNRDYTDYIVNGDEDDFPLTEFRERTTPGSRVIGYGKSMMVFHMINQRIGDEAFWTALRNVYENNKFSKASWQDFIDAFEVTSKEDLDWVLQQWIKRSGAPALALKNVEVNEKGSESILEFDIFQEQASESFRLDLPIKVTFPSGNYYEHVLRDMEGVLYHARIKLEAYPASLEIDPEMNIFRVLDPLEAPPTLAGFFADESPVIVIPDTPDTMLAAYRDLADAMNRQGTATIINAGNTDNIIDKTRSIMHLGIRDKIKVLEDHSLELEGKILEGTDIAVAYASRDENNPALVHLAIWGESPEAIAQLARKLPHYGKYSYVAFTAGTNIAKGQWQVKGSPLHYKFAN